MQTGFAPFFNEIQIDCIPRGIKGFALRQGRVDLKSGRIHDKMRFNPGHSVKCKNRIEVRDLQDDFRIATLPQPSPKR
ncbi:nuclear export factor GLE1 [Desmospora sp. 8437]|nr:nuclear export factor GLE1 [Desmospora sp. 8437]